MERGESGDRKSRARGEGEMCGGGGGSGELEMLFSFSLFSPQAAAVLSSMLVPSVVAPL